jgi:hypothetical protein
VWRAIDATDEYQGWWPWLRRFEADGLHAGDRWTCEVRPPLPYTVRFTLDLDEVVTPARVRSTIAGDIEGTAALTLTDVLAGCEVRLQTALGPSSRLLRSVGRLARPVARFGHDWVIATGFRQFAAANFPPPAC